MEKALYDLTMYILMQSGFGLHNNGFIYDTRSNEMLQYNEKMICYPACDFEGNVDVIPLDVSKSSKILDIIFAKFAANMGRYEDVVIGNWFITRSPQGSTLTVRYNDCGEDVTFTTNAYKLDSIAYAEALGRINAISDFRDLKAINDAVGVI